MEVKIDPEFVSVKDESAEQKILLYKVKLPKKNRKKVTTVCRLCTGNKGPFVLLTGKAQILNQVQTHLGLEIRATDSITKFICVSCLKILKLIEDYKQIVSSSQSILSYASSPSEALTAQRENVSMQLDVTVSSLKENVAVDITTKKKTYSEEFQKFPGTGQNFTGFDSPWPDEPELELEEPKVNGYDCKLCFFHCKTEYDFKVHELEHKNNEQKLTAAQSKDEEELVSCEVCGKLYKKVSLSSHKLSTHGEKNCVCSFEGCKAKFARKATLNIHIAKVHQKLYQLECDICGKILSSKHALKKHIRDVHEDRRDFVCLECNKAYQTSYNLRVHMRVHTKVQNFVCPVCDKGFVYKHILKKHMERDHCLENVNELLAEEGVQLQ